MLQLIKPGTNIDFVGQRKYAFAFSGVLVGLSILLILLGWGPRYGIDFAGGTFVHVRFVHDVDIGGDPRRARATSATCRCRSSAARRASTSCAFRSRRATSPVSGRASSRSSTARSAPAHTRCSATRRSGRASARSCVAKRIMAVVFSTLMMGVYIALRFEIRFGIGAAVALVHDVIVTIGALGADALRVRPHDRRGVADDRRLLGQRHGHRLRSDPREHAEEPETSAARPDQPEHQRDALPHRADDRERRSWSSSRSISSVAASFTASPSPCWSGSRSARTRRSSWRARSCWRSNARRRRRRVLVGPHRRSGLQPPRAWCAICDGM